MCHVETRSVVADEIGVLPLVAAAAELDAGRRAPGGELPGVAQQVLQSDLQQLGIAPYDTGRLDHEVRHPVRRVRTQERKSTLLTSSPSFASLMPSAALKK